MQSKEIREKYLKFFQTKKHKIIPSASLLPENDSTTLFIGSGMQPLVPYLMGQKHPEGKRLVNSQKSLRAEDIEEVGDNRHNTFFEMLGNWSLGDYFKEEQLSWVYEFLTKEIKLAPQNIYVTVFAGDKKYNLQKDIEAVKIWKNIFSQDNIDAQDIEEAEKNGMQGGKIFYYRAQKNWWSRSGVPENMPIGEIGGPDSEIFYDLGAHLKKHENSKWKDRPCHVNCDCGRFIEIGNSVFMEFQKTQTGFQKLPQKNVDFGGGLERITMVAQKKDNVFETDLFINILNKISKLSAGKQYKNYMTAFEIIADHIKASTFIIGDDRGVTSSNTDQGYVVRRLLRRAIRYGKQLKISQKLWTKEIAQIIIADYRDVFPELKRNSQFILKEIEKEEEKFSKTLEKGLKEFAKKEKINGAEAFDLYQTYGFPIEITQELAQEKGIQIDETEFKKEFKKHQELSRTASAGKFKGGLANAGDETKKLHTATHLLNAALRKVLGNHIYQKGSNITAERLRFDFSHNEKLTAEERQKVEDLVNEAIKKNLPITCEEMDLTEAKKIKAIGVFDSKYNQKVKVYKIGSDENYFSLEICGGPHAQSTGELGKFKIKKEQSSSAGVRRIKAILT